MPGDRENIVKLDADHGDVCRFDRSEHDQDNYELVERNMKDIYLNALKKGELNRVLLSAGERPGTNPENVGARNQDLQARLAKLKGSSPLKDVP